MKNLQGTKVIGIDLGGTNLRAGLVNENTVSTVHSKRINPQASVEEVMQDLFSLSDQLIGSSVKAIGIGVPSVVDLEQGIVYDVQNIPSWKEVPLKKWMEEKYQLPVIVNNDANCFALAEHYYGQGKGNPFMIGLTIGTGLGAGIIINNKLYPGVNCGAGEFGMVDYLDKYYEYYACGQFFQNVYQTDGELVFKKAIAGDAGAISMYAEMGEHLGNAIKTILYTYDTDLIILGGSVRKAYPYFSKNMWKRIHTLVYLRSAERLQIKLSELEHAGILGAAALYFDSIL
ncbi:MAG: ROK family protein [Bacteroidota bacterium]|nr:ROK family protein [Bacteroidota bacterium]MDP4211368.1 ROK family protein [Bacteroidota bacterium]MDP4251318.1 ROK family protein [Bacteroidota bacterium]